MALYLVQHGKSLPKDKDPGKGLSNEGFEETKRIADVAKGYKVNVSAICHSGKKRAFQTARIFTAALMPDGGVKEISGINPLDDVAAFSKSIDNKANIMVVGHLPFMERLTAYLTTGVSDKPVFKFQNSGIVCLDQLSDSPDWIIKWTLMPNIS